MSAGARHRRSDLLTLREDMRVFDLMQFGVAAAGFDRIVYRWNRTTADPDFFQ